MFDFISETATVSTEKNPHGMSLVHGYLPSVQSWEKVSGFVESRKLVPLEDAKTAAANDRRKRECGSALDLQTKLNPEDMAVNPLDILASYAGTTDLSLVLERLVLAISHKTMGVCQGPKGVILALSCEQFEELKARMK